MKHETLFIYTFRLFIEGMRNAFNEMLIRMNLEQISQYRVDIVLSRVDATVLFVVMFKGVMKPHFPCLIFVILYL